MPWSIGLDLHLDINAPYGRVLMVSATDSALLQPPPEVVAGDKHPLRLHFYERGANGTITAVDPSEAPKLIFTGRPRGIPNGSDLLFQTDAFTKVGTGIYEGTLDLTPDEFSDHLAENPAGAKLITAEVEIQQTADNLVRRSFQFDLNARPQVFDNQDTPAGLPNPEAWTDARTVRKDKELVVTTGEQARFLANLGISINADGKFTITTADGTFSTFLNLEA
jgi:hypothetical protein